ncbi:kinase [Alphaproteobacteria bacterium]|nr:kinase [Alphaproteobacteria bacterium]
MIITKTPYRTSFFGGGTDYREWFQENGGSFLSTTIDRHCYISVRNLPPFFEKKHRIVWSSIELVDNSDEISHPLIRAAFKTFEINTGLELHHQSDLPARAGLGSSSSFAVGLINAISNLKMQTVSARQLADAAIYLESVVIGETVGIQDQIAAAFGGLNKVLINPDGTYSVTRVPVSAEKLEFFEDHFVLIYTGVSRFASKIAKEQVANFSKKRKELKRISELVDVGFDVLTSGSIEDFGPLLHESWRLKSGIASGVSPGFVSEIYERALAAGATGGKVLGAGGGGFMLFFVDPNKKVELLKALDEFIAVPYKMSNSGSSLVYSTPDNFTETSKSGKTFLKY